MVHSLAIAGKVVTDSLPDIGIKRIWKFSKAAAQRITIFVMIGMLAIKLFFMNKNNASQRDQQIMLGILCVIVIGSLAIIMLRKMELDKQKQLTPPTA